jgi:hypothetical protein
VIRVLIGAAAALLLATSGQAADRAKGLIFVGNFGDYDAHLFVDGRDEDVMLPRQTLVLDELPGPHHIRITLSNGSVLDETIDFKTESLAKARGDIYWCLSITRYSDDPTPLLKLLSTEDCAEMINLG